MSNSNEHTNETEVLDRILEEETYVDEKGRHVFSVKEAFLRWIGLFLVAVSVIILYLIIINIKEILDAVLYLFGVIKPVIYGFVIAYILNPLVNLIQKKLIQLFERKGNTVSEKTKGLISGISIFLSLIFGLFVIVILCWMVIPQLVDTVASLIDILPENVEFYYKKMETAIRNNKFITDNFQKFALDIAGSLEEVITDKVLPWMQSDFLPGVNTVAVNLANGLMGFINVLYNLFIGIIVAIYVLSSKHTFSAQAKKLVYGIFSKRHADVLVHYIKLSHKMFSGFIIGKIVDSTIVGIICLVLMTLLGMPYPMLISVIIGVTNMIPVFGPYIGLIPSALLIVLVSPVQALYFIIMIAILMQVDGNLIGPAILGESTGLSAFWVLFSILFFGGIWGIVGMLIGVPLFAVIYRIIADSLNWKLRKKNLSTVTDSYRNLKEIRLDADGTPLYILYAPEDFEKPKKENPIKKMQQSAEKIKEKLSKKKEDSKKDSKKDDKKS